MSSIDSSIDACYGKYRKIEDMEGMVVDLVESFILGRVEKHPFIHTWIKDMVM